MADGKKPDVIITPPEKIDCRSLGGVRAENRHSISSGGSACRWWWFPQVPFLLLEPDSRYTILVGRLTRMNVYDKG